MSCLTLIAHTSNSPSTQTAVRPSSLEATCSSPGSQSAAYPAPIVCAPFLPADSPVPGDDREQLLRACAVAPDEAVWREMHHLDTNAGIVTDKRPDTKAGAELGDRNRNLFVEPEQPHEVLSTSHPGGSPVRGKVVERTPVCRSDVRSRSTESALASVDRQVVTCLMSGRGRGIQGTCRSHTPRNPRRAHGTRRTDPVRALLPARDEARHGLDPTGDLSARRRPRVRRPRENPARGSVQVPLPRHSASAADRRALVDPGRGG